MDTRPTLSTDYLLFTRDASKAEVPGTRPRRFSAPSRAPRLNWCTTRSPKGRSRTLRRVSTSRVSGTPRTAYGGERPGPASGTFLDTNDVVTSPDPQGHPEPADDALTNPSLHVHPSWGRRSRR